MENLALQYRPATFDDLVGQKAVTTVLRAMVTAGTIPTALLFSGSRGTGKTTTARILAAALNCDTPPGPCTQCVSCKAIRTGSSLDLVEIDAASHGLVDDIRALRTQILYAVGGTRRVVVLDEAHSMSTSAFNALLKTLEEPPPGTVFILATTEPHRIPDTVASRCIPFRFRRIPLADLTARLTHIAAAEHIPADPALLRLLAERADGALRDAVMALDQAHRAAITDHTTYTDLLGLADHGPALLTALATGNPATALNAVREAIDTGTEPRALAATLTATLRDLLVLTAGGTLHRAESAVAARTALTGSWTTPQIYQALTICWDLARARLGDDPATTLDLAVALISHQFTPTTPPPPAGQPAPRLSLAQMRSLA